MLQAADPAFEKQLLADIIDPVKREEWAQKIHEISAGISDLRDRCPHHFWLEVEKCPDCKQPTRKKFCCTCEVVVRRKCLACSENLMRELSEKMLQAIETEKPDPDKERSWRDMITRSEEKLERLRAEFKAEDERLGPPKFEG